MTACPDFTDPICSICGNTARILIADPVAGLDTLCPICWQARATEAPPRILSPASNDYDVTGHQTLKLIALAVIDAMIDDDPGRILMLLPGPYATDLVNLLEPMARINVALIRSKVGWDPEAGHKLVDTLRGVVLDGAGL